MIALDDPTHWRRHPGAGCLDILLVCAEADVGFARAVRDALSPLRSICAALDFEPGDIMDERFARWVRTAAVMAVFISPETDFDWYAREAIVHAIELVRAAEDERRLIPVYLVGHRAPAEMPFGLRRICGLFVEAVGGAAGVAHALQRQLLRLQGRSPYPIGPCASRVSALTEELNGLEERIKRERSSGRVSSEALDRRREVRRLLRNGEPIQRGLLLGRRFALIQRVGHGGFAEVWRAYDREERTEVALKILHRRRASNPQQLERFVRGARCMARLKHPSIVPVTSEPAADSGVHFFAMPYIEGGTLETALVDGRLTREEACLALLSVGDALEHAHHAGLVHRDVKPANILFDTWGRPMLADFDLVLSRDSTGGTEGGLGTLLYAAPETLHDAAGVDARADVFSLGMTIVFALYGRALRPADFGTHGDRAVVLDRLSLEAGLRHVIERALRWLPADRWPTMAAFVAALRAVFGEGSASVTLVDQAAERACQTDMTLIDLREFGSSDRTMLLPDVMLPPGSGATGHGLRGDEG